MVASFRLAFGYVLTKSKRVFILLGGEMPGGESLIKYFSDTGVSSVHTCRPGMALLSIAVIIYEGDQGLVHGLN